MIYFCPFAVICKRTVNFILLIVRKIIPIVMNDADLFKEIIKFNVLLSINVVLQLFLRINLAKLLF